MKKKIVWISAVVLAAVCIVLAIVFNRNSVPSEKETSQQSSQETIQHPSSENPKIELMIERLAESPAAQYYDPTDYLDKNSEEYTYLMDNSDETIRYIYNEFLDSGEDPQMIVSDPRRENVMAVVMKDIIGNESLKDTDSIGSSYFNDFWYYNVKLLLLNDEDYMKEYHKYGYLLIQLGRQKLDSYAGNTYKIKEIDKRIRLFDSMLTSDNNITFEDVVCCVTNSKYLKKSGEGIDIYKFKYNDSAKFNIIIADNKLIGSTYYLNDMEYAYNNSNNYASFTVSDVSGNKLDNSDDINLLKSDDKLKSSVISELKKSKYKDYVSSLDEDKLDSTLCYRYNFSDSMFVYNTDAEYVYVFGANINDSDSEYNDCKITVDAQTGEIVAVDLSNYFDNV